MSLAIYKGCKRIVRPVFGLVSFAVIGFSAPALANDSGSARISLGGKLRLESRLLMAEACENVFGETARSSASQLREQTQLYTQKLEALRNGDMALALRGPETERRVLSALDSLEARWQPMLESLNAISDDRDPKASFLRMLDQREEMEEGTGSLLAILSGEYSSAENFSFGAVLAVNIVDRQTVLLEEMALDQCIAGAGIAQSEESKAVLEENIRVFEASMKGLMNGQPEVGLMAPPTERVLDSLQKAQSLWEGFKPMLNDGTGGTSSLDARNALKRELNNARLLYLLATSSQPDLYRIPLEAYANDQLSRWLLEPQVIISLRNQNNEHVDLQLEAIEEMDQAWRAEKKNGGGDTISSMMARPLSATLVQYQTATNGIVTEVFVMDNKGLNVGQSAVTSDLWQGDEDKWQKTYESDGMDYHVSEVEFDDSTGFYQVQVSMPIADPVTQKKIGAVTFGVNIQSLL